MAFSEKILHLRWDHKNKLIATKIGNVKIFKGAEGGESRARAFGAAVSSVPAGAFGPSGASVPGVPFGAAGEFGVVGMSVLGVSFGGRHSDESWLR